MRYKISFCIPEHNECNLVWELVQSLLSNPDPRFQIVVSDNMTDNADPSEVYQNIQDERFQLYRTEKALCHQENWLRALERGEGEYLYLVMGRDWLDSERIEVLLSLLRRAHDDHVDLLIDRKSAEVYRPYYGIDAINRVTYHDHPTGLIISRASLLANQNREKYFNPDTLYPEMFIKRDILAEGGRVVQICSGVSANVLPRTSLGGRLSGADAYFDWAKNDWDKINNVYFAPKQALKLFQDELEMVLDDPRFHLTKEERTIFFKQKFQELLERSVCENKLTAQSEEQMMHYGMRRIYVPMESMFRNLMSASWAGFRIGSHYSKCGIQSMMKDIFAIAKRIMDGIY